MNIAVVTIDDIRVLKVIAEMAINQSVKVVPEKKPAILHDVCSNIDNWAGKNNCVFLKYKEEHKLIGFILIKEYWNLSDLFILPSEHRKGLGKKLFQKAIIICKKKTVKSSVRVNSSLNAVGFYKNMGFVSMPKQKTQENVVSLEYHF